MKITLGKYVCAACNHTFEAPMLDESRYGEFLLWSLSGRLAHLNAFEDAVYEELKSLVTDAIGAEDPFRVADILQQIFGPLACDPDPQGKPYSIDGQPLCPACRSRRIASWELIEPQKVVEMEIPEVAHQRWGQLTRPQKREAVAETIRSLGNGSTGVTAE
ncbi:hypothetical protein [Falsiroseomonas sp. E2-1-a20]|uniref:hypothetical protein n=1 Tax=Falsiroseomonas sp. E2-1-a20 TaxID=3239300 RepID=UPI003F39C442